MDYHEGQKQMVDKLEKSGLLERDHLIKTTSYAAQDEADIEDVVGRELYIHLVDGALALPSNKKMATKKSQNTEKRVVKEADAHCALLPVEFPEF